MISPTQSAELILDLGRYTLSRGGRVLRLEKQPMELLILLVEKRGQLVMREEIVSRLWGKDVFLDTEASINTAVRKIRLALHDNSEDPRVLETVVGKGYRFIAPISVLRPDAGPGRAETVAAAQIDQPGWHRAALVTAAVLITLSISFLSAWKWLRPPTGQKEIHSIAVLPLENLSADAEQEYFADGITDEIITDLAKLTTVHVISRTSVMRYKHPRKSLQEIGRELNVDAIVEGTVMRSGGRVRVTAQLIRTRDDQHLWADHFERDLRDVLSLQGDVARAIATKVELKLAAQQGARPVAGRPVDPDAYDNYLRGRYIFRQRGNREGLQKAIGYFSLAIQKDPSFAPAYAAFADCYSVGIAFMGRPVSPREAWAKASQAAQKALELDSGLADAHVALATVRFRYEWNWAEAEREYQRGIELDPNDAHAYQFYAVFLNLMRRPEEAKAAIRKAQELDPLSPAVSSVAAYTDTWAHRFDEAIRQEQKTLELDPNYLGAHNDLAWCYEEKGMWEEAVSEWLKAFALDGMDPAAIRGFQQAYSQGGIQAFRRKWLDALEQKWKRGERPNYMQMARLSFKLGDKSAGFAWLEQAYKERDPAMPNIHHAAIWLDGFRSEPRYISLAGRIGLPQAATEAGKE